MADYSYQGQTTVEMETESDGVKKVYLGDSFHRFGYTNSFKNIPDNQYVVQKLTQQLTVMVRLSPTASPDEEYNDFIRIVLEQFYKSEGDFTFYELRSFLLHKVITTSKLTEENVSYTPTTYPSIEYELTQALSDANITVEFYYNILLTAVDDFCRKHKQYVEEREMDILSEELQPEVDTDVFMPPNSFVPPLGKIFNTNFDEYVLSQKTTDSIVIDTTNFDTVITTLSNRTVQFLNHSQFIEYMEDVVKPIVVVSEYTFRDVLYCLFNTMMAGDEPIIEELVGIVDVTDAENRIFLKTFYPILFDVYRQMSDLSDSDLVDKLQNNNPTTNLPVKVEGDNL